MNNPFESKLRAGQPGNLLYTLRKHCSVSSPHLGHRGDGYPEGLFSLLTSILQTLPWHDLSDTKKKKGTVDFPYEYKNNQNKIKSSANTLHIESLPASH